MNRTLLSIASSVIQKANAERPADSVLRQELRNARGLSRDDSWEISQAVFAYYRWLGWIEKGPSLEKDLVQALGLAQEWKERPETFSKAALMEKSVPSWTKEEVDVTAPFARALQSEPRLWLRTLPGKRDEVANALRDCELHQGSDLQDTLEYVGTMDLFRTPEFHDGLFELQDISSQAVSIVCDPKPGQTWWDACAGEGGKTLHLSALMQNKGLIWASDRAEWRLKTLKQRTGRARVFNYRAATWDGSANLPTKTKFDGILVDAPCSGVGTWNRNPHARWTTSIEDVNELAALQFQILGNVAKSLKPGGMLIYSVCTLTRSETIGVAKRFNLEVTGFEPAVFKNPLQDQAEPASELFLWPQDSGGNGMFIAAWKKQ